MDSREYDVAIVGGGIIGCAIAYELSHRRRTPGNGDMLRIVLLDAAADLASGATRANSGILHGAYAADHDSLKGEMLAEGNRLWKDLAPRLSIPHRFPGALVIALDEEQLPVLERLRENGLSNGFEPQILNRKQSLARQPGLSESIAGSLFAEDVGIISPYEAAFALGQEAGRRGTDVRLGRRVEAVETTPDGGFRLTASAEFESDEKEEYRTAVLINAAGGGAADIASMLGESPFIPRLRRGQYLLFRRGSGDMLNHVLFQVPGPRGKGVLVTPTAWGNLMIGPNAETVEDPADSRTSREGLEEILTKARLTVPDLPVKQLMRDFAGIRAGIEGGDFYIEHSQVHPGLIHLGGIDSPGLTSAPAIARRVTGMIADVIGNLGPAEPYEQRRWFTGPVELAAMGDILPDTKRDSGDPERVVCRCEQVREAILQEAAGEAEAAGLRLGGSDAVKLRTRAGMGACQGQFCRPRVRDWLIRRNGTDAPKPVMGRLPSEIFSEFRKDLLDKAT
jgi:glycerol-3-phosphate dehydrogenase